MSSEITPGKCENPKDEQPLDTFLESSIPEHKELPNPEIVHKDSASSANEEGGQNLEDQAMQVASGDEEALAQKVGKLGLTLNETGESNNNAGTGTAVQNKLSESLSCLQEYGSDDDSWDDLNTDDDVAMKDQILEQGLEVFSSGCDSDSEDTNSEDYDSMDDEGAQVNTNNQRRRKETDEEDQAWMAEIASEEVALTIPDISTLELNNKDEFQYMGTVECTIDKFVTISALPGLPAFDLDTLLFLENGTKVLGYISDVMGPVLSPIYVLYLDSIEAVQNLGLRKGMKVYCAPKTKYTKIRGSDASWVGDAEVPPELEEFSDDEEERRRRKATVENEPQKRKRASLERYRRFETSMNKMNKMNTRLHNMMDERNPFRQRICDAKKTNKNNQNSAATSKPSTQSTPTPPPQLMAYLPAAASDQGYFSNPSSNYNWPQMHPQTYGQEFFIPPPGATGVHPNSFMTAFDPSTPPPNYGGGVYFPPNREGPPSMSGYSDVPCTNLDAQNVSAFGPICRPNNRPGPSFGN